MMKLKIKFFDWSAGLPVAILNKKTAEHLGVYTKQRILIKSENTKKEISTIVDTMSGPRIKIHEIIVSSELKSRLGLKENELVEVSIADVPESMDFIKNKLDGEELSKEKIYSIIEDVTNNALSEAEIAVFVTSMYKQGMSFRETTYLIGSIIKFGNTLKLNKKIIADKHSIGGIPGNRTTPIVVAICAAAGLTMPKTSSRAITSAAGTADVIETIAKVDFPMKKLKSIVEKTGACLTWGGALDMVPADSKIIQVEKLLKIDPEAQLLASIMSKKLAAGSTHILIDIPYGKTAKVDKKKALYLKKKFEKLGKHFKRKLVVVLTKAEEPMGDGVGPALELIDVIKVLNPNENSPRDLEDKSLLLAGILLEMTGKSKKREGIKDAKEILQSGKAFEKFKQIINAQGGNIKNIPKAKYTHVIKSNKSGKVVEIDNKKINSMARATGCPTEKSAGLVIHTGIRQKVTKSQKLLTIHANSKSRIQSALKFYKDYMPIEIK